MKLKAILLSVVPLLFFMAAIVLLQGTPIAAPSAEAYVERGITFHDAATITAVGEVLNTSGLAMVAVQLTGTYTATVTFQGTVDGSNWVAIQAMNMNSGAVATTATANGLYIVPVSGLTLFRCNLTFTAGTSITVTGMGTDLVFQRVSIS